MIEAVVTLSNLAENPETHAVAFDGARGEAAFALFVNLLQALTATAAAAAAAAAAFAVIVGSLIAVSGTTTTACYL